MAVSNVRTQHTMGVKMSTSYTNYIDIGGYILDNIPLDSDVGNYDAEAFNGTINASGQKFFTGYVYGSRLYGAVILMTFSGNAYIISRNNGTDSLKTITTT